MTTTHQYDPDYTVPPGWVLAERLEVQGISPGECARLCGCTPLLIESILAGQAPITPLVAQRLEQTIGLAASVWLGLERDYTPEDQPS